MHVRCLPLLRAEAGRRRGVSAKRNNCAYAIPHELTGIGTVCGLFHNVCNGHGKMCLGFRRHTPETRRMLADAIAERKRKMEREAKNEQK